MVLVPPVNERPELSFQRRGRQPGGAETSRYNLGGFILGGLTRLTSANVDETLLQSRVIGLYLDMNGNSLSKTGQETEWLRVGSSPFCQNFTGRADILSRSTVWGLPPDADLPVPKSTISPQIS